MNLDRFEVGLEDSQAAASVGCCDGCGGEIYRGEEIRNFGHGCKVHVDCVDVYLDEISYQETA